MPGVGMSAGCCEPRVITGFLTAQQSASKTTDGQNRDVHLLAVDQKFLVDRVIPVLPERIGVVSDVTVQG